MGVNVQLKAERIPIFARTRSARLECKAARRRGELQNAFRLIYERYQRDGLADWNPHGLRILPHQLLDTTWVLLARRRRRFCGTLSLIEDGAMGLPIERLYPAEIWRLRRQGKRVAELACFALSDDSAGQNVPVLRALLRSAYQIAADRAVDELVICVHPRRATFYERRLGFQEFGPLRCCPWVCDQPAVAMRLTANDGGRNTAVIAGQSPSRRGQTLAEAATLRRVDRAYFLRLLDSEPARSGGRRIAA